MPALALHNHILSLCSREKCIFIVTLSKFISLYTAPAFAIVEVCSADRLSRELNHSAMCATLHRAASQSRETPENSIKFDLREAEKCQNLGAPEVACIHTGHTELITLL